MPYRFKVFLKAAWVGAKNTYPVLALVAAVPAQRLIAMVSERCTCPSTAGADIPWIILDLRDSIGSASTACEFIEIALILLEINPKESPEFCHRLQLLLNRFLLDFRSTIEESNSLILTLESRLDSMNLDRFFTHDCVILNSPGSAEEQPANP